MFSPYPEPFRKKSQITKNFRQDPLGIETPLLNCGEMLLGEEAPKGHACGTLCIWTGLSETSCCHKAPSHTTSQHHFRAAPVVFLQAHVGSLLVTLDQAGSELGYRSKPSSRVCIAERQLAGLCCAALCVHQKLSLRFRHKPAPQASLLEVVRPRRFALLRSIRGPPEQGFLSLIYLISAQLVSPTVGQRSASKGSSRVLLQVLRFTVPPHHLPEGAELFTS